MENKSNLLRKEGALQGKRNIQTSETKPILYKFLQRIVNISLVAIFFGLPLFFTGTTYQGLAFEKQLYFYFWILIGCFAWMALSAIMGKLILRRTAIDLFVWLVMLFYILSAFFSADRWHSVWGFFGDPSRGLLSVTALLLGYYLIVNNFNTYSFKLINLSLLSSNLFVAVWLLLSLAGVAFLPQKLQIFLPLSSMGSLTSTALYICVMLPVLLSILFSIKNEKKAIWRLAFILISLQLFLNLYLLNEIHTFVPWLALLMGVGFFMIYLLAKIVRPQILAFWIAMGVFIVVFGFFLMGRAIWPMVKVNLPLEATPNAALSWEVTKASLKNNFFLGSGPATYGYAFALHKPHDFNNNPLFETRFYQGSGLFFESITTLGLLGSCALILLALAALSVSIYLLNHNKEKNKLYSLGYVAALVTSMVGSLTSKVEGPILIFGILISFMALIVLNWESEVQERTVVISLKASPKYALPLAFAFMLLCSALFSIFIIMGKFFWADNLAGRAIRQNNISETVTLADLNKATSLFGQEGRYYTRIGQEYMILANNEFLKSPEQRDVNKLVGYLKKSIDASAYGQRLMPNDALAAEVLAQVYENSVYYLPTSAAKADEAYELALSLEPQNPIFLEKRGELKLKEAVDKNAAGREAALNDAKKFFQQAVNEKADFAKGFYFLSLTKNSLGDLDGATEDMVKALRLESGNNTYALNLARILQQRSKDNNDLDIAEALYKKVIEGNDSDINAHFGLGTLYEKKKQTADAIEQYNKASLLLPDDQVDAKKVLSKMIGNLNAGIENPVESMTNPADFADKPSAIAQ